jgi:ADP-dependent NAD(P)H-hydrate dehydratase / NAD(P)H-hydrate epimerase
MNADPPTTLPDAPPPEDPGVAAAPAAKEKPRRRGGVLLGIIAGLIVLGAAAGFLGYEPLVRHLVQRETQRLGFIVTYDSVTLSNFFSRARLHGAHVDLDGVRGLHADVDDIGVELEGLQVKRIITAGVRVTVEGSAADRLLDLGAWSNGHPELYRVPGEASGVAITWAATAGEAPWLTLQDGALSSSGGNATFHTPSAKVAGLPIGAVGAAWSDAESTITVGLGSETIADAPIRVELHPREAPATAALTLRPIKLASLGAPLGLALPAPGAVAEGSAALTLGSRAGRGVLEGTASFTLTGWVPPHPRELGGIVFGDRTTFATKLSVSEDHRKVTLTETAMTAGALKLKGGGTVERRDTYALSALDLKGSLACSDVARSAVASSWGDLAGQLAGGFAQIAVEGSVGIKVHVEADTRDLKAAKLTHEVGVGCGLRIPKLF